jgi:hypothetical protein
MMNLKAINVATSANRIMLMAVYAHASKGFDGWYVSRKILRFWLTKGAQLSKRRQLSKCQSFQRRADAQITYFFGLYTTLFCNQRGQCQRAGAALTRPHAAARERFDLVGSKAALRDGHTQITGGFLLAAADDDIICRG